MIQTLKCPSCSAPVEFEEETAGRTLRCPFCYTVCVVPESLRRDEKDNRVVITFSGGQGNPLSKGRPVLALVIVGVILAGTVGVIIAVSSLVSNVTSTVSKVTPQPPSTLAPPALPKGLPVPTKPGLGAPCSASESFERGSEGIGQGMFTDARSIAVDGEGRIYVAEYTGGRVQVFDPSGKFITQWMADAKMPLRGMAADRRGTVYIAQKGKIDRYDGATGKKLGELPFPEGWGFDDVTATADGGLVAAWYRNRDDIVRFDSSGQVSKVIREAISGQTERSELDTRVAVDGLGNIYALGHFNSAVLKFTPDGKFVNKFGGAGEQPGQFRAPQAIAVDGRGRVYVSDIKGIQVFDSDGRYINVFKPSGLASGMTFHNNNQLFIAARTKFVKCVVEEK
jgi:sugar lactone lactonase YvrE